MIIVYKILQIKARSRQKYVENRVLIKHSYFKSVKLYLASEMTHSVFFLFFFGGEGGGAEKVKLEFRNDDPEVEGLTAYCSLIYSHSWSNLLHSKQVPESEKRF